MVGAVSPWQLNAEDCSTLYDRECGRLSSIACIVTMTHGIAGKSMSETQWFYLFEEHARAQCGRKLAAVLGKTIPASMTKVPPYIIENPSSL